MTFDRRPVHCSYLLVSVCFIPPWGDKLAAAAAAASVAEIQQIHQPLATQS
jgi:hypothetical protein